MALSPLTAHSGTLMPQVRKLMPQVHRVPSRDLRQGPSGAGSQGPHCRHSHIFPISFCRSETVWTACYGWAGASQPVTRNTSLTAFGRAGSSLKKDLMTRVMSYFLSINTVLSSALRPWTVVINSVASGTRALDPATVKLSVAATWHTCGAFRCRQTHVFRLRTFKCGH